MPPEVARNSMADLGDVWPPGFRFHPTDEELVLYYLKRKISRRRLRLDVITEVDVYKWDPEDLPGLSLLKTGDRQWFFFSPMNRKYPNGSRSNRATGLGYWKLTGKDRPISCNSRVVGLKKTLIFYKGRAPKGERTDWVLHEYTLDESELMKCQDVQDYYALYKVFKKSGAGPKNGEEYGAPFKEEDWVDDELPQVSNYNGTDNHVEQSNGVASVSNYNGADKHVEQSNGIASVSNYIGADNHVEQSNGVASVSNYNGADKHVQQSNGVPSVDIHNDEPQVQCTWDDIEEFMKKFVDCHAPERPDINDYEFSIPQVIGEEAPSTMTDLSFGKADFVDPCKRHPPYSQQNMLGSMNFTLPAASQVQLHDTYEVASTELTNLEQHLLEEDFLEMDDLLAPETTVDVGDFVPQPAGGELTTNSQLGEFDGLSEFDQYYRAEMFIREPSPINQATTSHSNLNFQTTQWAYDQNCFFPTSEEPRPETMPLPTTGDMYAGNFTPKAMESHSNRSGKGVEGNDKWYTSALWSFVESIPTTPASAADSALVNRAFVRMSSFIRLRINPKSTTTVVATEATTSGSTGGRMKGFFLFSFMGAFFAFLYVLIGNFGKTMLPLQQVK